MLHDVERSYLLPNLILFGRLLRALGLDVSPGRMIDLVQALSFVEIGRRDDFFHTTCSLLVHDQGDLPLFKRAFDLFWRRKIEPGVAPGPLSDLRGKGRRSPVVVARLLAKVARVNADVDPSTPDTEMQELIEVTRTYSRRERLRRKSFAQMSPEEVEEVTAFITRLQWQPSLRRTRRYKQGDGTLFDLRRALRKNLRYGGEFLEWPTRRVKLKPRPLVVLADISGSMERYTRLLLHFVYGLTNGLANEVQTFLFSTHLTAITRHLRRKSLDRALQDVAGDVPDWAGGTRIGAVLRQFNFSWGRRLLGRGAIVLLISDGWDRGDPQLVAAEMARLQRSCRRLIWLNPHLGHQEYEPLTRGMQAALPYIDDFLPVHNLASLEDLRRHLASLADSRSQWGRPRKRIRGAAFISAL